jgi:hypothetical protein
MLSDLRQRTVDVNAPGVSRSGHFSFGVLDKPTHGWTCLLARQSRYGRQTVRAGRIWIQLTIK